MRKKVLSLLCVLALCLGLLPVTALAAGEDVPNVLCVGTTNIGTTSYNDNAAYWTSEDGGTTWNSQQTQPEGDSYIYYDGQGTLELHNVTIQGQYDDSHVFGAGIYALCGTKKSVSLTIQLTGNNTITGDFGIYVEAQQGGTLGANASLSITGDGSLTVTGTASYGLYVKSGTGDASLTIKNASVDAKTTQTYSSYAGVCVQSGASATGSPQLSLAVNGGSLTASASEGNDGIQFYVGNSSASVTTSLTVSENAIVDARNGGISALKISETLPTPTPTGDNRSGIVFDGSIGTVYGSVTLQDDLEIKSGETLTVPEGSKLDCNNNLTNNGTILASGGTVSGNLSDGKEVTTPSISDQPTNQTVTEGSAAEFSVTASDAQTYQWQQSTDSGSNWTNIESATSAKYTTEATTTSMSGYQYRCVVKSSCGVGVISSAATLTVTALPEPEPEPEPTPPPYIPPTYAVTAPETTGGAVTVSPSRASSGRTVTITATPDLGYELESLTVLDSQGNEIALTDKGDGKYTFTMPASRVTVEASFTPAPLPFEDVAPGAWYESAVRHAYFHNIMEGMSATTFQPNGTLSRAMAVQIFYNLEGHPDISDENLGYPYEDVDAQAWYGDAVYWARITGVATGYGDGTFQPTDSITRQEFAQMLYNYAKYKGYDLTAEGDLSQFPDSSSVADWAKTAMSWANGNKLINGHDDGTIDAAGIGTRAQAASILMRFDQNLAEK